MYFPFDQIRDGKVLGPQLNGSLVGSVSSVPGIKDQAIYLDGTQYVDFGNFRLVLSCLLQVRRS